MICALPLELCLKETLAKICLRLSGNDVANIRWCKEAKYIKTPTMGWWQESPPLISHSSSLKLWHDSSDSVFRFKWNHMKPLYFVDSLYKVIQSWWRFLGITCSGKTCFSQASATSSTSLREYFQNHYKQGATFEHSEYQAARSWSPGVSLMVSGCWNSSWLFDFFPKVSDFFEGSCFFPKVSDFFEGSWKKRKETWWFESVRDIDVGCHNMEPNVIEVLVH